MIKGCGRMQWARIGGAATILILALTMSALAASGEAHHVDSGVLLKDFLYRVFNFAITFGLLAFFLIKPIRQWSERPARGNREDPSSMPRMHARKRRRNLPSTTASWRVRQAKSRRSMPQFAAKGNWSGKRFSPALREMATRFSRKPSQGSQRSGAGAKPNCGAKRPAWPCGLAEELLRQERDRRGPEAAGQRVHAESGRTTLSAMSRRYAKALVELGAEQKSWNSTAMSWPGSMPSLPPPGPCACCSKARPLLWQKRRRF